MNDRGDYMVFFFCRVYDDMYYTGCKIRLYQDRLSISLFVKKWVIPYEAITKLHYKRRIMGIEYVSKMGEYYIEILAMNNKKLKHALSNACIPIITYTQ